MWRTISIYGSLETYFCCVIFNASTECRFNGGGEVGEYAEREDGCGKEVFHGESYRE